MAEKDHICKWKQERLKKDLKKLKAIVREPRFLCTKCGRVAVRKQWLCEPTSL